uniref:Uncharacterized protein n=1 Tax=Panagrellus redivivus TaxID=6233 RepID=A0A7E5A1N4_PANRE
MPVAMTSLLRLLKPTRLPASNRIRPVMFAIIESAEGVDAPVSANIRFWLKLVNHVVRSLTNAVAFTISIVLRTCHMKTKFDETDEQAIVNQNQSTSMTDKHNNISQRSAPILKQMLKVGEGHESLRDRRNQSTARDDNDQI